VTGLPRPRSAIGAVDLPPYVKPYRKLNGRVFYYYEKFRNTAREWPRFPLPHAPNTPEFWRLCQQIESIKAQEVDGQWVWEWAPKSGGSCLPLPSPLAEGGMVAFCRALDEAEARERLSHAADRKTFSALVEAYTAHKSYLSLSDLTKRDYDGHLRRIVQHWGDDPVANLTTVDAQKAIDALQSAPTVARYFRAVLSRLIGFGIPRGFCAQNPVRETEKVQHEADPHEPWPDWAFELFLEYARPSLHLPVFSAFYTGQRSIDVIPMARPNGDEISLIARKTGKLVWRPVHSEYADLIVRLAPSNSEALHLREDGEPWTLAGFRTAWQREFTSINAKGQPTSASPAKKAAMSRLREAGLVFHGLRKNAVNALLEVGCTEAEVSAIVEMSEQMVRHYARDVNKRELARRGTLKMEQGWSETRKRIFGKALERAPTE
jgi:integrase